MENIQNFVQLLGRVGADLDLKTTSANHAYVQFNIAINESHKNSNGEKTEETNWYRLVAFGKTAENLKKYATKGKQIAVQGKLVSRNYEQNGEKKYVTEIVVKEFMLF